MSARPFSANRVWPDTLVGRLGASLVAFLLFSILAATVLEYHRERGLVVERALQELGAQTDLVVERLDRELVRRQELVSVWPDLEAAQDLAVDDIDRRLARSLVQLASSFGGHTVALGVSIGGDVLAASDVTVIGQDIRTTELFRNHLVDAEGDVLSVARLGRVVSAWDPVTLDSSKASGSEPALVISETVRSRSDGRDLGWIVLISPWPEIVVGTVAEGGPVLEIRKDGELVYMGDVGGVGDERLRATRPNRTDVIGPLEVTLSSSRTAALAPLRGNALWLFGFGVLVAACMVPLALLLLGNTTRELHRLTETAEALDLEALDLEAPPRFSDVSAAAPKEVRVLAASISSMVERLEASRKELARKESAAAVGLLAAGLAHEIRTPLAVLRGSAEMLERRGMLEGTERELVTFIHDEVERLARLVDDLLFFARPRLPDFGEAALHNIVDRGRRALQVEAENQQVSIHTELEEVMVHGDAEQLYQVVLNLLDNAISVSGPGKDIVLSSGREGDLGWISVADNGPGIAPEVVSRVWEPLFTTRKAGTGLGLAVVKRIVDEHGGATEIKTAVGQGTTFTVRIPCIRPDPSPLQELSP